MKYLLVFLCFTSLAFPQDITKQHIDSIIAQNDFSSFKMLLRKTNQSPAKSSIANFKYIDSVIKDNDTLRLHTYMYYTSTLLRNGENKEALRLNTIGLYLAKKYNSPYYLFEYYQMRANVFDDKAIMDSTIFYINKAESIVTKNQSEMGHKMTRIYQQRAIVEQKLGNLEKEEFYIEKIAEVVEEYPNKNNAFDLAMVVYHFKTTKNYAKHAYYSQKLQEFYLKKEGITTPKSHESISSMLKMDNTNEQIKQLKQIINTNDSLNYSFLLPQTANILGSKLLEIGKYQEGIHYLNKSLEYNTYNVNLYSKSISYDNLYAAYYETKDYKKAVEALELKNNINNSIRQKETLDKIADFEVKYETEKKTAEVELLKAENKNKEQQKQLYLVLAFSGLVVASLLGFFAYRNRKQKLILAHQKTELEATVVQKNMLFKEIHHRVKNSLQMVSSLLFLQGQNIENNQAKSAIKDAQNRVRSLGLIHQKLYSKKHIEGVATTDYITDLTEDIFNSHQLESQDLNYNLEVENMVLHIDTLTPIGLILNELIVNVLKHAFKETHPDNKLLINFYKEKDHLILKVQDNGLGYDATKARKNSFGLKLINSLSRKLDATFTIQAKSPKGTETTLVINDFEIIDTK